MVSAGLMLGGRYLLLDTLARDGAGELWRGLDQQTGQSVAVRVLPHQVWSLPGVPRRFRDVVNAMSTALRDPAIAEIYAAGDDIGVGYVVMEYVEGESLRSRLQRTGRLQPTHAMALVAQASQALQVIHDQGLVHDNLTAASLMLRANGRLVLTDLGVAQAAASDQRAEFRADIAVPEYRSPEQTAGGQTTAAADIYALGVVAYEMLTGSPPVSGAFGYPPALPSEIPPAIQAVVMRALTADPSGRWESGTDMARAATAAAATVLAHPTAEPEDAPPIAAPVAASRPTRSRLLIAALAVLVAAGTIVGLVIAWPAADTTSSIASWRTPAASADPVKTPDTTGPPSPTPSTSTAGPSSSTARPSNSTSAPTTTAASPENPSPTTDPPALSTVPDVVGMTESAAQSAIIDAGLTPHVNPVAGDGSGCMVTHQSPPADTPWPTGNPVTIDVPQPPDCEPE